jgi:hypothetical protein
MPSALNYMSLLRFAGSATKPSLQRKSRRGEPSLAPCFGQSSPMPGEFWEFIQRRQPRFNKLHRSDPKPPGFHMTSKIVRLLSRGDRPCNRNAGSVGISPGSPIGPGSPAGNWSNVRARTRSARCASRIATMRSPPTCSARRSMCSMARCFGATTGSNCWPVH